MIRWNAHKIHQVLDRTTGAELFPPASNRTEWTRIRDQASSVVLDDILADARHALAEPPAFMPASLYLKFRTDGDRRTYESLIHARGRGLASLALAECLEHTGAYLTRLQDYIWAICEQSTWSYPAHLPDLPDVTKPHIDLGVAMTGLALSEVYLLLGEEFEPGVQQRIRHELNTRLWQPYLDRHDFWWQHDTLDRTVNNWTAVCTAGVVGSAVHMGVESAKLADMIAKALGSMEDYLATFDPDGGSTEGPGYWDYGFGYYSMFADILRARTERRIDLFDLDIVEKVADFPWKTRLSPGVYVPFSDCDLNVEMEPALLKLLARDLEKPHLLELKTPYRKNRVSVRGFVWTLRDLVHGPTESPSPAELPEHVWFSGMHWMISRDLHTGLVLAIKGGHNAEMHNQNDVGSLVVHLNGETLLADPGRGVYTRQYFGPERYDFLVNNSAGHSVPVVNGLLQETGIQAAATLLDHRHEQDRDSFSIEMRAAYPESAELESLVRTVMFDRTDAQISLIDTATFAGDGGELESVLISLADVSHEPGVVTVRGERNALHVVYDPDQVSFQVDTERDVALSTASADIHRLRFMAKPGATAEIALSIRIAS